MKKYLIEIMLQKDEISSEFLIICWKEEYFGTKTDAIKRAKELQKQWKAEYYNISELENKAMGDFEVVKDYESLFDIEDEEVKKAVQLLKRKRITLEYLSEHKDEVLMKMSRDYPGVFTMHVVAHINDKLS